MTNNALNRKRKKEEGNLNYIKMINCVGTMGIPVFTFEDVNKDRYPIFEINLSYKLISSRHHCDIFDALVDLEFQSKIVTGDEY